MDFPLEGVRVLDLSRVFAGPLCGQVLADFGAEVVKVEHPGRGDDTRDWGMRIGKTETTYYNSMNRNKRSITVDLQTPEGQKLIHDLLPQFDVVIQNFKTGGADKLGLGYPQLKALKPDLIYCSVAGYNSSGPEAKRPGYDLVIQGEAGLMAINGEAHQPPLKFGVAVVDMMTGMFAAQAVLAALGLVTTRVAKVHQGVEIGVGYGKHMAAATAVAAIGAAKLFVFFVAKRDAAVPPIAGGDVDIGFVNKFHSNRLKSKAPTNRGFATLPLIEIRRVSH